jgi:hypothetical protein
MDRLHVSMDILRRLAKEADDPNCVVSSTHIDPFCRHELDHGMKNLIPLGVPPFIRHSVTNPYGRGTVRIFGLSHPLSQTVTGDGSSSAAPVTDPPHL